MNDMGRKLAAILFVLLMFGSTIAYAAASFL